jgi:hypothetical protein
MTHAIDRVFIDAILVLLLRELGLPEGASARRTQSTLAEMGSR